MYKIYFTKESKKDLLEILEYTNNNKVIEDIFYSIGFLSLFPYLGKELIDNLREYVVTKHKFRVIYQVKSETIEIYNIFRYKNLY